MTDSEFLAWLADRLVHVHGEPENIDFVLKLRRMASAARGGEPNDERLWAFGGAVAAAYSHEYAQSLRDGMPEPEAHDKTCARLRELLRALGGAARGGAPGYEFERGYREGSGDFAKTLRGLRAVAGGAPAVPSEAAIEAGARALYESFLSRHDHNPPWDSLAKGVQRAYRDEMTLVLKAAYAVDGGSLAPAASGPPDDDEPIDLLATAVGALTDDDVIHLAQAWTDIDGCFYGTTPEWRASLLGYLRDRVARLAVPGEGTKT